jgi:class 3 adenylate cyclase
MTKILVVDDEAAVRMGLKKVLEKDGYDVLVAEDGQTAIDVIRNCFQAADIVISDFKMPGMDGLETLTEIGKLNPEITRIMLTGYATLDRAIESVNIGIDGFLTKPFDNNELRAKVREFNMKRRLKQFVSEQVLSELNKTSEDLVPSRKRISILFADIRRFSAMSEKMSARELAEMLNNHFFKPLDNIVFEYNGTLDKHIGDGIMAIFGAPMSYDNNSMRAVLCALKMREKMAEINETLTKMDISIGIGIGTGEAMVGIFGSPIKKEYTAHGQPVILASRLERMAKENEILVSASTYDEIKATIHGEAIDHVTVKGLEKELTIYKITGKK